MPAPISDDKRQQIIDLCADGKSARSIAKEVDVSVSTVSKIAKEIEHQFGQSNVAHAQEVRAKYGAERRAITAARFHEEADKLLEQLSRPHLAFNFGGRDNTYTEHQMPEPPIDGKRALIQSAQLAMRTVLDIDKHDNREEHGESKGLLVRIVESVRADEE